MTILDKVRLAITGTDPQTYADMSPAAKRKDDALCTAIWIPTGLWCSVGFLAARSVFNLSIQLALLIGLLCGCFVFACDRVVILSKGGLWAGGARIGLAGTFAIIASLILESLIFAPEAKMVLANAASAESTASYQPVLRVQENAVEQAYAIWKTKEEAATRELTLGGRGRGSGGGPIYRGLVIERDQAHAHWQAQQQKLEGMRQDANTAAEQAAKSPTVENAGLLSRIGALQVVIRGSFSAMVAYICFAVGCAIAEILPLVAKCSRTPDDDIERMQNVYRVQRAGRVLSDLTEGTENVRRLPVRGNVNDRDGTNG